MGVTIKQFKNSHDWFLIIDDKELYHIGASLKDLGQKWFAFSRMDICIVETNSIVELFAKSAKVKLQSVMQNICYLSQADVISFLDYLRHLGNLFGDI